MAGPGFLNVTLAAGSLGALARTIVDAGEDFGRSAQLTGQGVNLEFVSANPTGPVTLASARWAAVGDALARILEASGAAVVREYYFNDHGAQIDRFARSLLARAHGEPTPEDGYPGGYMDEIAARVVAAAPDVLDLPRPDAQEVFRREGVSAMFEEIRSTLAGFGVTFDVYFLESSLHDSGAVDEAVALLKESGRLYFAEGAWWLRSTEFGDDKDRVVVKSDGSAAYIAGDLAYLRNKRQRGFDLCIYFLGADHHGYIARLKAAAAAFDDDPDSVEVLIGQMVNLVKDGKPVRMGKRAGNIITLEDLVEAVGVDAARYSLSRSAIEASLDVDLDLLVKHSNDNPVYYVQYAHARTCNVARNAARFGIGLDAFEPELLTNAADAALLTALGEFPRIVAAAATMRAPHRVAHYLESLAGTYHRWYDTDACRVTPRGDAEVTAANRTRAWLNAATRIVLANGLEPARRERSGADVSRQVERWRHPAGPRHADVLPEAHLTGAPADLNALDPVIWPTSAQRIGATVQLGGIPVPALVGEHGTPAVFLDEEDVRARARTTRRPSAASTCTTPGKAFLCTTLARWVAEEGLGLDVCTGGELAVALAAGFPPQRIGVHGNNKSLTELVRAVEVGVGHIIVDSFDEIRRLADVAAAAGVRQRVLVRVTVGVEAHTHEFIATAHEDQKFGFSLRDGPLRARSRLFFADPALQLGRPALAHRFTDLRDLRLRGGGSPIDELRGHDPRPARRPGGRAQSRRWARHRVRRPATIPRRRSRHLERLNEDREVECASVRPARAEARPSNPAARSSAPARSPCTRSGRSRTSHSTAGRRESTSRVDGGMSDNIRTALYDAEYTCVLANRESVAPTRAVAGGRQALREWRRRSSRHLAAGRCRAGRSARRRGDRRLLPQHGEQLQPCAAPAGGGGPRGRVAGHRAARDRGRPAAARCRGRAVIGASSTPCTGVATAASRRRGVRGGRR